MARVLFFSHLVRWHDIALPDLRILFAINYVRLVVCNNIACIYISTVA